MGAGRDVWVKIRASEAGHAELYAMSLTVGEIVSRTLTLSKNPRTSVTSTACDPHARDALGRHGTRNCEDGSEPTSPARTGPLETLGSGKIRSQWISQGLNVPTVLPTVGIARSGDQLSLPLYLLVRLFKLTHWLPVVDVLTDPPC